MQCETNSLDCLVRTTVQQDKESDVIIEYSALLFSGSEYPIFCSGPRDACIKLTLCFIHTNSRNFSYKYKYVCVSFLSILKSLKTH